MKSKLLRKFHRRLQFALMVARYPNLAKPAYKLIRTPMKTDATTLDGLSDSGLLKSISNSSLMWSGNPQLPLRIAMNKYITCNRAQALSILRRTPGTDARMLEGQLFLYCGDLTKAMAIFSAAAERAATKATALKQMALCRYLEGDLDAAIDTVIVAAAIYPRVMSLMTLFSRIVRNSEEIDRYLMEKLRLAKNGLTANTSAQLIRACGRAGATNHAEAIAKNAIINICAEQNMYQVTNNVNRTASGVMKGQFSSVKGDIILEHIANIAEQENIRLFLMGGTLLGLIRDEQLLSWDKDLDFGCFAEEADISKLWEIFSNCPYFIPMGTVGERLIKLKHVSGVTVDIFVNTLDKGMRWHGGQFVSWRNTEFSLKEITFRNRQFHIPEDPEAYLANHYGAAWDQPDPHFDVFWEAPDAFDCNVEHRYVNTLAKGIQFLAAQSFDVIKLRHDRALNCGAEDVSKAYQFTMSVYEDFGVAQTTAGDSVVNSPHSG